MKQREPIGGYLELELNNFNTLFHDNALALNSGRNCLEYILRNSNYKHLYIPYYTCDVMLEPINKIGIGYTFYRLDKYFMPIISDIKSNEALIYSNYFGLMNNQINELIKRTGNLIIDNAQAFYDKPLKNIPTFYSPRKFFGVPDGGFVYAGNNFENEIYEIDLSMNRMGHLLGSIEFGKEKSYDEFKKNENSFLNQPIKKMSKITSKLLKNIDYDKVKNKRMGNFEYLHEKLRDKNELSYIINEANMSCPLVYPFLTKNSKKLRENLIINRIFSAQYWPNVLSWTDEDSFEHHLTRDIIHLPINQNCNKEDMDFILQILDKID